MKQVSYQDKLARMKCWACKCKGCIGQSQLKGYCSIDCQAKLGLYLAEQIAKTREREKLNREKEVGDYWKKKKREFRANDIKTRKAAAKKACHEYIRLRDRDLPCICCNKELNIKVDAGHWLESGHYSKLRYHEDNIHAQRYDCNRHKGGDSGDYEKNLRLKIGDERVNWLIENKEGIVKRTAEDYKEIETYYKAKTKALLQLSS